MEELQQFMETITKAMPGAWDAAVRQAYLCGTLYAIFAVIAGIISLCILIHLIKKGKKLSKELGKDYEASNTDAIVFLVMVLCVGISILCLCLSIMYFVNPEYQAMEMLINI